MITKHKQKAAAGAAAATLLLLGGVYAWSSSNQHKTNEFSNTLKDNDVTLVEDFESVNDWQTGQEINKDISVKNNTAVATGSNAYVRISLKEFLEFTNKTEELSKIRYAVTTAGDFAKFDTQAEAQAYADANGLGNPEQISTTAFEGANKWFIQTQADATHGQYGKFLVLSIGDAANPSKSIIDPAVSKAANIDHQAVTHDEDAYTTQLFNAGDASLRNYPSQVKDYPAGGGIEPTKDLKDYITWTFGSDVTTLEEWENSAAKGTPTAKWIIDTTNGYVYWGQALAPSTSTTKFLDSVTLKQTPKDVALYYAIHTNLEAVDYDEINTVSDLPTSVEEAWRDELTVTLKSFDGSQTFETKKVKKGSNYAIPNAPEKAGEYFLGWAETPNTVSGAANQLDDSQHPALYTPSNKVALSALNQEDKRYLGYAAKTEHQIKNVTSAKTLYAVYYKSLDGTTAQADEFIWSNAVWRVLNANASASNKQRLVIKVNALTMAEAAATGQTAYDDKRDDGLDAAEVRFHNADDHYFNAQGKNSYETGELKQMLDGYYEHVISSKDKADILAVDLHNPDFTTFKDGIVLDSNYGDTYDYWYWSDYFKDNRFTTEITNNGTKQAFALSWGDINSPEFLNVDTSNMVESHFGGTYLTDLLNFEDSNADLFWLRSAGIYWLSPGCLYKGNTTPGLTSGNLIPVRPSFVLTTN
jgi:alternate signal-mediated exported protein